MLVVVSSSVCVNSEPADPFVEDGETQIIFYLCVTLEGVSEG